MPTVLAVDDDRSILDFLRMSFQAFDIQMLTATSAAEGLATAARHKPEVVILDVESPDLSGLELLKRLHELDHRTLAIVITGRGTTASAIQAMSLGAYEYLLKPLQLKPLRELLTRALEASQLMRIPAVLEEVESVQEAADVLI